LFIDLSKKLKHSFEGQDSMYFSSHIARKRDKDEIREEEWKERKVSGRGRKL
jgi:hypothetical protein